MFALRSLASVTLTLVLALNSGAWAQSTAKPNSTSSGTALFVNGVAITDNEIDKILNGLQGQGNFALKTSREQVTSDLVVKLLMLDEAKTQKIESSPAFMEKMEDLKQRLLIDAVISDYLGKNPISEADEKAEYERQKKVLGGGDTTPQYLLRQVLVKTEQEGRDLIARAQKGESFERLAQSSIDETGNANGGMIGWVFPSDLFPTLAAVVVNLQKGVVAAAPIRSNAGWHVVKVDDIRPFKIPSFEETKPQIKQALFLQRRQALVDQLLKKAVIKRP